MLLYIIHDHPSVSQTFAVREAAELSSIGIDVLVYALHAGAAPQAAADCRLVTEPPSPKQLVAAALRSPRRIGRAVRRGVRARYSRRELARVVYAEAHASLAERALGGLSIDHVHAHFLGRTSDVAASLSARLGCAWSATAHASDAYSLVPGSRTAEPRLAKDRLSTVAAVVCASDAVRQHVEAGRRRSFPTPIVHCGVDVPQELQNRRAESSAAVRLVTVARLVPRKGYRTIVEASRRLRAAGLTYEWDIVGDGELREELASAIGGAVPPLPLRLLGALDHQTTLATIAAADVFVLPCELGDDGSLDGIPVALMEAMARNVLVVTTQVGGIGELVVDGRTGYVVPESDPTTLADKILDIAYSDSAALGDVRNAARQRVADGFDSKREARKLADFFRSEGYLSETDMGTQREAVLPEP